MVSLWVKNASPDAERSSQSLLKVPQMGDPTRWAVDVSMVVTVTIDFHLTREFFIKACAGNGPFLQKRR